MDQEGFKDNVGGDNLAGGSLYRVAEAMTLANCLIGIKETRTKLNLEVKLFLLQAVDGYKQSAVSRLQTDDISS